ncbi:hypothetical protein M3Y97_01016700 [Aphelenchoides bicaudatus]|nr:hypothetical protein M3Y97_01016700 [Aphelenchoides bicaudatus]
MGTTAECREQLERHLQKFREVADERMREKIAKWGCYIPAMISTALLISQLANTVIFASFAYNFGTTLQLIFPAINIFMFAWIVQDKKRHHLPTRIQMIYLLAPALALVLSIAQACTIYVTLSDSIYTIRFLLSKLLGVLLELNKPGRLPIESFFGCEFYNDDDIVKPPCAGTIHDTVVSRTTVNVVIAIHLIPVIFCIYIFFNNLKSQRTDHLFLYIESVDPAFTSKISTTNSFIPHDQLMQQRSIKDSVKQMVNGWNVKFMPKKVFDLQMGIGERIKRTKSMQEPSSETTL